jgi:hypothetical protein
VTPIGNTAVSQPRGQALTTAPPPAGDPGASSVEKEPQTTEETTSETDSGQTSRTWLPLTVSLLALFASLGANFYLGWMTLDIRRRFRHFAYSLRHQEEAPKHA